MKKFICLIALCLLLQGCSLLPAAGLADGGLLYVSNPNQEAYEFRVLCGNGLTSVGVIGPGGTAPVSNFGAEWCSLEGENLTLWMRYENIPVRAIVLPFQ